MLCFPRARNTPGDRDRKDGEKWVWVWLWSFHWDKDGEGWVQMQLQCCCFHHEGPRFAAVPGAGLVAYGTTWQGWSKGEAVSTGWKPPEGRQQVVGVRQPRECNRTGIKK